MQRSRSFDRPSPAGLHDRPNTRITFPRFGLRQQLHQQHPQQQQQQQQQLASPPDSISGQAIPDVAVRRSQSFDRLAAQNVVITDERLAKPPRSRGRNWQGNGGGGGGG
ncbi:hypothetical protein HK405_014269, partial [Cladochytrium tenue]